MIYYMLIFCYDLLYTYVLYDLGVYVAYDLSHRCCCRGQ
jgi:hypothetical protein